MEPTDCVEISKLKKGSLAWYCPACISEILYFHVSNSNSKNLFYSTNTPVPPQAFKKSSKKSKNRWCFKQVNQLFHWYEDFLSCDYLNEINFRGFRGIFANPRKICLRTIFEILLSAKIYPREIPAKKINSTKCHLWIKKSNNGKVIFIIQFF